MGFKIKKGKITYKSKAGIMNGYIPEPCKETKDKSKNYSDKLNKKKLI